WADLRPGSHRDELGEALAMSSGGRGSVSHWLGRLQAGDPAAAQKLWERYFEQLVRLARKRFQGKKPRGADEEDVALSAFDSFCRGAQEGRSPQLGDRDDGARRIDSLTFAGLGIAPTAGRHAILKLDKRNLESLTFIDITEDPSHETRSRQPTRGDTPVPSGSASTAGPETVYCGARLRRGGCALRGV